MPRRTLLLGLWLLALAAGAAFVLAQLRVDSDLRSFMPPPADADQALLMEQIGEGPGSRLLLLAIDGPDPDPLARLSEGLAAAVQADPAFSQVANGAFDPQALDPELLPWRWLLTRSLDAGPMDAGWLRAELEERVAELASPAGAWLKDWLARDPTLEVLRLAEAWAPPVQPRRHAGVWFSARGEALLVAQTAAAGFDPGAQAAAIAALHEHFNALPKAAGARLVISGPGAIAAQIQDRTRGEAQRLGRASTAGFLLLLLLAYRSVPAVLLAALPVATGAVAGLAALALGFGGAHGITLAFGFTLLGVVQEYPLRLLSHRRPGEDALASIRALWPLLATAIASAAIACLAFFASGVAGLQQLAVFTIAGLLAAGLATRFLLPRVLPGRFADAAATPGLAAFERILARLPRPAWLPGLLLAAGAVALWLAPGPLWLDDLAALTPADPATLARDGRLRAELGAADVRYLLVIEGADDEAVLQRSEALEPLLSELARRGVLDAVELPSRYLPSRATQARRQAALPDRTRLQAMLAEARVGLPFRSGLFQPFIDDVEAARRLAPLTPAAFGASPAGARLAAMLVDGGHGRVGLGALTGVHDPAALQAALSSQPGARLLDLKAASESLVVAYRGRILHALAVAFVLLALTVLVALRSLRRAWHVLAPMTLATFLVLAVERAAGIPLSLFHLVALTLAAGLGLHYALFFERPAADAADARRTLHATLVCVASALLVFGLQALSSLPVLRAIGLTVALGVGFHFCLSILMARAREPG